MESRFEHPTDHTMTEEEMRQVLELYAEEQKEKERLAGQPTVEEVSEALAVPTDKVSELLQRVRSRQQPQPEPPQPQYIQPQEVRPQYIQPQFQLPPQPQPYYSEPIEQDTYEEEIYVRRRYSQNPIVAIVALIVFALIAFGMFSVFSRTTDRMMTPFGGGSRPAGNNGWVETNDGHRIPINLR